MISKADLPSEEEQRLINENAQLRVDIAALQATVAELVAAATPEIVETTAETSDVAPGKSRRKKAPDA